MSLSITGFFLHRYPAQPTPVFRCATAASPPGNTDSLHRSVLPGMSCFPLPWWRITRPYESGAAYYTIYRFQLSPPVFATGGDLAVGATFPMHAHLVPFPPFSDRNHFPPAVWTP